MMGFKYFLQKQTFVDSQIKISITSYLINKPQMSEKNELIKSFTPSTQSVIFKCTLIQPDDLLFKYQCEKMKSV